MSDCKVLVDSAEGIKVLTDSSDGIKVLTECGACECELPEGDCPHVVCCEINFDQEEIDGGGTSGSFIFVGTSTNDLFYVWYDFDNEEWTLFVSTTSGFYTLPESISAGTWYQISVGIKRGGACGLINLCANGNFTGWKTFDSVDDFVFGRLFFGAYSAGFANHHSMRNIAFLSDQGIHPRCDGDTGSWPDKTYPFNGFDAFTGGVSEPGDGILRIDSDDFNNAYAEWDLTNDEETCYPFCQVDVDPCGPPPCCDDGFVSISVTGSLTGTLLASAECTENEVQIDAAASGVCHGSPCIMECFVEASLIYECAGGCESPEQSVSFGAHITTDGTDYFLHFDVGSIAVCGTSQICGGDDLDVINIGPSLEDAAGTYTSSPVDPHTSTVSYNFSVTLAFTPCPCSCQPLSASGSGSYSASCTDCHGTDPPDAGCNINVTDGSLSFSGWATEGGPFTGTVSNHVSCTSECTPDCIPDGCSDDVSNDDREFELSIICDSSTDPDKAGWWIHLFFESANQISGGGTGCATAQFGTDVNFENPTHPGYYRYNSDPSSGAGCGTFSIPLEPTSFWDSGSATISITLTDCCPS